MKNPWTTKSTKTVYDNPWLGVDHSEVINPRGGEGIYGVVRFKNHAIGIVPIDDEGYTYLVGQFRYATNRYEWEIPEGGCPVGTDPLATAKRELKEETGLVATGWTLLLDFYTSNSVCDEYGIAYLAEGLSQEDAEPEETEDLKVKKLLISEAIAMTLDGRIKDAVSIMALQKVALLRTAGR
ncbi:NUDIX domain-containing protein [Neolewinella antarctica]|uniref:GDP-mannose pyrophosphatase n=1 Tax=Neolewinella antarctica TaxID=442734 RepID=A0ABX0XAQ3_9BACT|nr:NUDIX hydrolase [Neolewinella antarctica]NJC26336.1 8-oxo-dGTP pyrophosphatase MutT (NUDIX family) [Neolewinella antarctica]